MKFTTPVAFKCESQEQQQRLANKLVELEYKSCDTYWNPRFSFLITNYGETDSRYFSNNDNGYRRTVARSEAEFLALASMTDSEEIKVGDLVVNAWGHTDEVRAIDDKCFYFWRSVNCKIGAARKATKEEIIAHFDKIELAEKMQYEIDSQSADNSYQSVKDYINSQPEKPEPIFKKDDIVNHWRWGEGIVMHDMDNTESSHRVNFKVGRVERVQESELSFTPYTLVAGGFSQERPDPKQEYLRKFIGFIEKNDYRRILNANPNLGYSAMEENICDYFIENPFK